MGLGFLVVILCFVLLFFFCLHVWEEIVLAYSLAQVSGERGERIWSYHGAEIHNHTQQLGLESVLVVG